MRPVWVTLSSIQNWILGVMRVLSGLALIILSTTIFDTMSALFRESGLDDVFPVTGLFEDQVGTSIMVVVMIGIGILIFGAMHCAAGYGLWGLRGWARILAIVLHIFGAVTSIGTIIGFLLNEFLASTLVPFLFLCVDATLATGLLLPSTARAFENGGFEHAGGNMQTQVAGGGGGIPDFSYSPPPNLPPTASAYGSPFQPAPAAPNPVPAPVAPPPAVSQHATGVKSEARGSSHYATPGSSGVTKTEVADAELPVLAWLVERNGPRSGREHRLRKEVRIGRDPGRCEVVLDDSKVSAEHAHIRMEDNVFVLYDLASTNRTFVNGKETQKHVLHDGDEIGLGPNVILAFVAVGK